MAYEVQSDAAPLLYDAVISFACAGHAEVMEAQAECAASNLPFAFDGLHPHRPVAGAKHVLAMHLP
jgi:hypothetical protein